MSGQQPPVAPGSSTVIVVEDSSSEAEPNTVNDGTELWEDIKAQTGFNSYGDYVKACMVREDRTDLRLLWHWMNDVIDPLERISWSIVDLLAHEESPPSFSARHSLEETELLEALHQPPKHACVQVLILPIGEVIRLDEPQRFIKIPPEFFDTLGLVLRVDPQFFLALMGTLGKRQQFDPSDGTIETRPLRPTHVVIDRTVATFVRHYPSDKPAAPPIIVIAGHIGWSSDVVRVAQQNISNALPSILSEDLVPFNISPLPHGPDWRWMYRYQKIFSAIARNNPGITRSTAAIIAGTLMPLLRWNCLKIRTKFLRLRRMFLELQGAMDMDIIDHHIVNNTSAKLHRERFWLRRSVEDSDDGMSHFESYISAEDANYLPESSAYLKIKQQMDQIHKEARRLDTEVRDYLQLVVGNLALEESRKSIELSNHQIQEGKRGL